MGIKLAQSVSDPLNLSVLKSHIKNIKRLIRMRFPKLFNKLT